MASALLSHRPSPSASPSLLPAPTSVPSPSRSPIPIFPASASPRSYVRAPAARPYALSPRNQQKALPLDGDTKAFAQFVVDIIENRARKTRMGGMVGGDVIDDDELRQQARKGRSLGGSLAGSWETERAEFIVDVPVWSPGCFQDLSTLHALRDTTLSHTHSLLAFLMTNHSIPASYRLLPRSAINGPRKAGCRHNIGWGCIRLAPSVTSPIQHKRELKPAVRRTSAVYPRRPSDLKHGRKPSRGADAAVDDVPPFRLDMEHAIADEDEEEDVPVELKEGYRTGGSSDDEGEEDCADVLVAREVEKRGTKEGEAFMMTLFGSPALILC